MLVLVPRLVHVEVEVVVEGVVAVDGVEVVVLSNSTPSGESAQASTSGTVHTHAAETCIGNRPQETSVTIAAKTPYPIVNNKRRIIIRT
jgi:hypothetical protein